MYTQLLYYMDELTINNKLFRHDKLGVSFNSTPFNSTPLPY